jgi:hypothetical protein
MAKVSGRLMDLQLSLSKVLAEVYPEWPHHVQSMSLGVSPVDDGEVMSPEELVKAPEKSALCLQLVVSLYSDADAAREVANGLEDPHCQFPVLVLSMECGSVKPVH